MPASALHHPGDERAGHLNRSGEVGLDDAIELVLGERIERAGGGHGGVGDEHVDVGVRGQQGPQGLAIGEIARRRDRAELGGERVEEVSVAAREDQLRALGLERPRHRSPKATRRAGEEHLGITQLHGAKLPHRRAAKRTAGRPGILAAMPLPLLAIFGPTAVGKTAVAVAVAEALRERGEDPVAIGVDALQVYAELPLLTAQPSREEQARLEHRLVGFLPATQMWSVAEHAALAHAEIDAARAAGRAPIVVGGTGLYLRAALTELSLAPPPPPGIREALLARANEPGGLAELHAELVRRDPAAAEAVRPTDTTRVVRAHELLAVGRSFSEVAAGGELWAETMRVPTVLVGLTMARDMLRERAAIRMAAMIEAGVIDEVQRAHELGAGATAQAAVGYRELLVGDADAATTKTRQLAKRQETWMRRLAGVHVIDVTGRAPDEIAREILQLQLAAG
jgi:tRNA dimethylallyltransferase